MADSEQLQREENALRDFGCVGRAEEIPAETGETKAEYRVWPTSACAKQDIVEACEHHTGSGYTLDVSETEPQKEYVRITVALGYPRK